MALFTLNAVFLPKNLKKQLTMNQLSEIMLIFASSVDKNWRHREEQLSFDPSENLENSK